MIQVASGETLAAWAERELEAQRVKHRTWLAGVTAEATTLPRATSRPTDQATQVGPSHRWRSRIAMVPPLGAFVEPSPGTSLGRAVDDHDAAAPPNRRAVLIALLLAGSVVFVATRSHEPAKVAVRDAAA